MKLAIVTGSAHGLGYELSKQLIEQGWDVCGIDFDAKAQEDNSKELGGAYHAFTGDVTDENFCMQTLESIEKIGHVDMLINNAGQPVFKKPADYTASDVAKCLKGLEGMIIWSAQTLRLVNEQNVTLVNIMSTAATRGNAQESVYCATKWGERGYTESLKAAYKGSSVKVVGVYPGGIDTNFYEESRDYVSEEKQHSFMPAKDLAQVIIYNLTTEANLMVTNLLIERNYQ
ncbi:MAG: SDR family oxidoreductase [Bifidobacteriaceae bacterium]|nr:SDR family oxidoreductase [Bifidobacteriaceae bacterium]